MNHDLPSRMDLASPDIGLTGGISSALTEHGPINPTAMAAAAICLATCMFASSPEI
jgi:hypothetical protein